MSITRWLGVIAVVLALTPSVAAADLWVATRVRGSVLALVDNQWSELNEGDGVADGMAVRTLQAGRVVLVRGNEVVTLDPNTAVRATGTDTSVTLEQFAGVLALNNPDPVPYTLLVPGLSATASGASLVSRVGARTSTVSVRSGRVPVSAGKRHDILGAGQTMSVTPAIVEGADAATDATAAGPPEGDDGESGIGGESGTSDNGVGNGGQPGNGGQNGNAGGNGVGHGSAR